MKSIRGYLLNSLVTGILIIAPIYLCALLLLKAMGSVAGLVRPLALLVPDWLPGEALVGLLVVVILCLAVGMIARTAAGHAVRERIERSLLERMPGYTLFRSLTRQLAGESREGAWKPALAEIEEALVPAFIIEELDDGRYTVFVPSVPTPLAGAVYVLDRARVHPLDVPFTQAIKAVSRWGQGARDLVAAMEQPKDQL